MAAGIHGGYVDELQIKAAVLTHLRRTNGRRAKPVLAPEYTLGSSGVRADLAIWAHEFIGVEIKSAGDSLRRLPNQMRAYAEYFDRVLLVVAERHLKAIDSTMLAGATIWSVNEHGHFCEIAVSGYVPSKPDTRFIGLLTRSERQRIGRLETAGEACSARSDFEYIFRRRYGDTSEAFWKAVQGRSIDVGHLQLLSRFSELRTMQREHAERRHSFWAQWTSDMAAPLSV